MEGNSEGGGATVGGGGGGGSFTGPYGLNEVQGWGEG